MVRCQVRGRVSVIIDRQNVLCWVCHVLVLYRVYVGREEEERLGVRDLECAKEAGRLSAMMIHQVTLRPEYQHRVLGVLS